MNSLYAYFGLVDLHKVDIPGHSLYQLGLIDSLSETYGDEKFDFFSYLPEEILNENTDTSTNFPSNGLGAIFNKYYKQLISEDYCPDLEEVLGKITNKEYNRLYLKARFRNLSTLAKKWKDALYFEKMIETAISAGYKYNEIIILDTDLSLPKSFYGKYNSSVTVLVPSIDFNGISNRFLGDCLSYHKEYYVKDGSTVFYGNIDTSNYKSGNQKSPILTDCIEALRSEYMKYEKDDEVLYLIHKITPTTMSHPTTSHIHRKDRDEIFDALTSSSIMLNVTKDKYDSRKFIPARIYEALIFGMVPVSYGFNWLSDLFSFKTVEDLMEIVKYIRDLDNSEDIKTAYFKFVENYFKYTTTTDYFDLTEDLEVRETVKITKEDIHDPNR